MVTGAGGFIGSHLVQRLVDEGAKVTALVRYNSTSTTGFMETVPENYRAEIELISGNIADYEAVEKATQKKNFVFHLAAMISVPYSYEAPAEFVDTNVTGTMNILQATRHNTGLRVIHTSSSEVYGSPDVTPITEDHPLRAQSPYAASKIAADKFVESFYHSFGVPSTIVRPFNTYGPRQSTRAIIPTILSQALAGTGIIKVGSLWPRRDVTFVEDTVDGFIKAATTDAAIGQTIHLGTGVDYSIEEMIRVACEALNVSAEIQSETGRQRPEQSEVKQLISDNSRAKQILNWSPKTELPEGMLKTAEWIKDNLESLKVGKYVV